MELSELYDKLLEEGFTYFHIRGVGGPSNSDVFELAENAGIWEIYYTERGQKQPPIYVSANKEEAIVAFYDRMRKIKHLHLVAFTRSADILNEYKEKLEAGGIETYQNDIPAYKALNDCVHRLFVINKGIFKARELFNNLPYFDGDLRPNNS